MLGSAAHLPNFTQLAIYSSVAQTPDEIGGDAPPFKLPLLLR
jgi:hypothetical protein